MLVYNRVWGVVECGCMVSTVDEAVYQVRLIINGS